MRKAFIEVMKEIMKKDPLTYILLGDVASDVLYEIRKDYPNNILNMGINEQATMGIASGMALEGLKPYVFSIAPFVLERPFEQVKLDVVQQNANVKIVGFWHYPTAGPTHYTKEPKKICDILGLESYFPKDSSEVKEMIMKMHYQNKPAFFYLTRAT
jgi:transketolase